MMKKQVAVAIPASVVEDTPHLREKTAKIGYIARSCAIFRVNEIIVYADKLRFNQKRDVDFISLLLRYLETPQYLRKRLFELKPELQFAGILPPLRTPNHPQQGNIRSLKVGDYREGIVISKNEKAILADIGAEKPAVLINNYQAEVNQRLTLKIVRVKADQVEVQVASKEEVPEYWGYEVTEETRPLREWLENRKFDLTVGTSKLAPRFQDVAGALASKWHKAHNVLLLFGAPSRGLFDIAKEEGVRIEALVDFVINTVPEQGTETVRTEEALLATMAIFNEHFWA
ncbi:MAG TPA: putative RNA uridine N3 methyltransferase [Candidatus Acidoferrales bacterium]|nr:putative RNA uridine N3 methyltransferase [Candidatus Acidoferrales bacterium]